MLIHTGLFDHMVLQRSAKNVSDAEFTGESAASGALVATVTRGGKKVRGLDKTIVGKSRGGRLTGRLVGVPAGGPYRIDLAIVDKTGAAIDKLTVKDVCVGDVWIAAGQSNMQGCGKGEYKDKPHPLVRAFYMDDHWAVALDPIHQLEIAVDAVHNGGNRATVPGNNPNGVGPAIAFAKDTLERTGVPQGILACAHGGTSMSQWDPALLEKGGHSLYGAAIRRLRKNGNKIAGIIWYQGESDCNPAASELFTDRMKTLVKSFRRDAKDSKLPFVAVQLGRLINTGFDRASWNSVQDQQRRQTEVIPNYSFASAVDLQLDDSIHVGSVGMKTLGRRLAYAMDVLRRGARAGKPPITFKSIKHVRYRNGLLTLRIEFDNVVGKFRVAEGTRPTGFAIGDPTPSNFIFDTELDGDGVILYTTMSPQALSHQSLYYGYGTDPFCNILDGAGRLIPVMGPISIAASRAVTECVNHLQVAYPVALSIDEGVDVKLNNLKYPADINAIPWKLTKFTDRFCDVHLETDKLKPQDYAIFFRTKIIVPEPMKLGACLGYDGPIKLWIDGEEKFHNPNGTNPAYEDMKVVKFDAAAGTHEVVIALGSKPNPWGIYLRFERFDVTKQQIKEGSKAYAMPKIIVE